MFKHAWSRFKFGIAATLLLASGYAFAQPGSLGAITTSPVVVGGFFSFLGGPQSSVVGAHGGTVTCSAGGTPTVANTNITANSVVMFGLKTAGGTPVIPSMLAVTIGTSFQVTCGGADTSIYNYIILG